jgi:hypothetical protein
MFGYSMWDPSRNDFFPNPEADKSKEQIDPNFSNIHEFDDNLFSRKKCNVNNLMQYG